MTDQVDDPRAFDACDAMQEIAMAIAEDDTAIATSVRLSKLHAERAGASMLDRLREAGLLLAPENDVQRDVAAMAWRQFQHHVRSVVEELAAETVRAMIERESRGSGRVVPLAAVQSVEQRLAAERRRAEAYCQGTDIDPDRVIFADNTVQLAPDPDCERCRGAGERSMVGRKVPCPCIDTGQLAAL